MSAALSKSRWSVVVRVWWPHLHESSRERGPVLEALGRDDVAALGLRVVRVYRHLGWHTVAPDS